MKKIFNLTAILVIVCTISNAQSITSITETNSIQCNGQTTTLTVVTDATNTQLPSLWYNLYVNVMTLPNIFWVQQNTNPISLPNSTFQTQSLQPDEYMVELVDGPNNNTNTIMHFLVISNMTVINPFVLHSNPSTSTNVTCNGFNDGTISTYLTGGTPPYTLNWTGPMTFSDNGVWWDSYATGLLPGIYNCALLDANNCSFQGAAISVNVTEPLSTITPFSSVTSNYNGEDISCNGGSNGQATANGGGGTPYLSGSSYTYVWEDAAAPGVIISTSSIATGLSAGA